MKLFFSALFLGTCVIFSCSPKKGPSEILIQANDVHNEALGIYSEAHELYETLKRQAETSNNERLIIQLDSIHELLHRGEDGVYEVPGCEHDHGEQGHSHEHSHVVAPRMTDQSMLDYQINARKAIEEIREVLQDLINQENE